MQLDILAIGAHPDDVELSCSGTLAKAALQGYRTGILDLTEGELGTRGNKLVRGKEGKSAARILGCVRDGLHMHDGNIEVNMKNLLKLIQLYRRYRPKIIF